MIMYQARLIVQTVEPSTWIYLSLFDPIRDLVGLLLAVNTLMQLHLTKFDSSTASPDFILKR